MNVLLLNKKVYHVDQRNVRDGIIKKIRTEMPGTPFAAALIAHLQKMGSRSLDKYNDLELVLEEHHVTLRFATTRTDGEAMRYTLDRLTMEPCPEFKKRWTDVIKIW
jgi:hypothetical protein